MAAMSWNEKHRPVTWDQVMGNERCKAILAEEVRSTNHGSVMLSGPSGCGKSTLARIYARSILCTGRGSATSPCGQCAICSDQGPITGFHHLDGSAPQILEDLEYVLEHRIRSRTMLSSRHVILVEEAQNLSLKAQDILLHAIEEANRPWTFLFTLIDQDRVQKALRDRCTKLRVELPSLEAKLQHLFHLAKKEDIAFTPDAARLLAAQSVGFRELIGNAETVSKVEGSTEISIENVRDNLMRDRSSAMVELLGCQFEGQREKAFAVLDQIELAPAEQLKTLREMLLYLKRHYVGPEIRRAPDDPLSIVVPPQAWSKLASLLHQRAAELGYSSAGLLDIVLSFWGNASIDTDAEAMKIHVARACDLARPCLNSLVGEHSSNLASFPVETLLALPQAKDGYGASDCLYLSVVQAREIYHAASALPQLFGVGFNAHFDVFGDNAHAWSDRLTKALSSWWKSNKILTRCNSVPLCRISVKTNSVEGMGVTHILHLPASIELAFRKWLVGGWRATADSEGIAVTLDYESAKHANAAKSRHWRLVRRLWSGLNPDARVGNKALLDVLGVPTTGRKSLGIVEGRRFSVSEALSHGARQRLEMNRLGLLSAWDDRAWQHLFEGWEWPEHRDRTRLQEGLENTHLAHGHPATLSSEERRIQSREREARLTLLSFEPHLRARSWTGWW